jgi:hypothetical protein
VNDKAIKKKPLPERIAGLDVKTSYRDIRDGIGACGAPTLTDQDIAAALGMVKTRLGPFPPMALETYFGSTLRHERRLREKWSDLHEQADMSTTSRIICRFSAAIAIRQFAGIVHSTTDMAEYSYLLVSRPRDFAQAVQLVLDWLEVLKSEGLTELRKCCREGRATLDSRVNTA